MGPILQYVLELIRRYHLDDRSVDVRNFLRFAERRPVSESIARAFSYRIQDLVIEQERRPNLLHRVPELEEIYPHGPPPLVIGNCRENEVLPVGLSLGGALHCVFGGTTGAGKTVAIRRLVFAVEQYNQNHDKPIVIIILDRKLDYADLPEKFGSRWAHYDVHAALRIGLQSPLGVPPDVWIGQLATIFCARAGLIASWATIANMIRWAVAVMNPKPGDQLLFPDFQLLLDLAKYLPKTKFADKPQYTESFLQALRAVTQVSGSLFRTFNGLDVERDLVSQGLSAVISMPNLEPPWLSHFIAELIVSQVLLSRMQRAHRVDVPEVLFVLDESDEDVSRASEAAFPQGSLSPIARTLRQGREFGIGVALGVGALGPVSQQILNACTHHFLFRMGDADCRVAAARTLQIPPGADAIIPSLEPGECLAKTPYWPHAVLCQVDFVPPCRDVHPQYDVNLHVPAERLTEMPALLEAAKKVLAERRQARKRQEDRKHGSLTPEARELLYQASRNTPYTPVARLYDLMDRPTPRAQKAIRQELQGGGYARLAEPRIGSRNVLLIELLEPAWRLLGKPPVPLVGRGSLEHRAYANWIMMVGGMKRGYESFCEHVVPNTDDHPVDAAWRIGERWNVFECVVSSMDNLSSHLEAIFLTPGSPVEKATIVASQKSMLCALRAEVHKCQSLAHVLDCIAFAPVEQFEKELWP